MAELLRKAYAGAPSRVLATCSGEVRTISSRLGVNGTSSTKRKNGRDFADSKSAVEVSRPFGRSLLYGAVCANIQL
jgi:hypothetical protein